MKILVWMEADSHSVLVGLQAGNWDVIHTPGMNKVWSQSEKRAPLGPALA